MVFFSLNTSHRQHPLLIDSSHKIVSQSAFKNPSTSLAGCQLVVHFTTPVSATTFVDEPHDMASTTRCIPKSEWEQHRADIERLYCDENRTLKEVQGTMQAQHNFNAR